MDIEEIRKQAQDENTAPEILAELAISEDYLTRQYVAANPNISQYLIEQLSRDEEREVKIAVAMNPNTSEETLLSMIEYDCDCIKEAIASNKNASNKVVVKLLITSKKQLEEKLFFLILENNYSPPQKLIDIAIQDRALLRTLMSNKHLDLKILNRISNLTNEKIELRPWRIASNSRTSVETLVELSNNTDFYTGTHIRYLVATNPKTPTELSIEILEQLIEQEKNINFCLMEAYLNKTSSAKVPIVEKYIKHSLSKIVRLILLFNPDITQIDFEQYSKSLDWLERYAIAQNKNIPCDLLYKLTEDANRVVRAAAKENLEHKQINEPAIN